MTDKSKNNGRNWLTTVFLTVTFALSVALSLWTNPASAQFVDRITRPCGGANSGLVIVTTTNINMVPCPGGSVTINGVPLVIVPGGGLGDPGANGIVVRTALNTTVARTLTTSAPITIVNATGVAGNPLIACATCGITTNPLSQFAATTSAQLRTTLSDENGTGAALFDAATTPSWTTGFQIGGLATLDTLILANGTNYVPGTLPSCSAGDSALTYNTTTHAFGCNSIASGTAINATDGTVPYRVNATSFGDSPITRLSATHLQIFAAGVGGADFDTSAPAIVLNGGSGVNNWLSPLGQVRLGDIANTGNATFLIVDDVSKRVLIGANGNGDAAVFDMQASGGSQYVDMFVPNVGSSLFTEVFLNGLTQTITFTGIPVATNLRTGTASNTDLAGSLTVGGGGTVTRSFTQTYTTAPVCVSSDTDAVPLITGASASTTVLTVTGNVGHVVNYVCVGLN